MPPYIAVLMSTCFDGACLLMADYSLRYAQDGLSGSGPRFFVRVFALVAAFLQTYHARLGNEPRGSWILWASLPVIAVSVYEVHIRWERRAALARAGLTYPASLPIFGLTAWVLFPLRTLNSMREIVASRLGAVTSVNTVKPAPKPRPGSRPIRETVSTVAEEPTGTDDDVQPERRVNERDAEIIPMRKRAPKLHKREWARANGWPDLSDRTRYHARSRSGSMTRRSGGANTDDGR